MPKIIFFEPKAPDLHIFSKFPIPRLGNPILASMAKARGWDAEVIFEEITDIDLDDLPPADLVGVSSITSTAPRAYGIADAYRRRGVPIIMGGPHVSFLSDEALDHADYVIRGEGEYPFGSFLSAFEQGSELDEIPSLSFRRGDEIRHNAARRAPTDLTGMHAPNLSLIRSFWRKNHQRIVPVETSRGCPFNCEFCSVSRLFGRKMRYRPINEIVAELKDIEDRALLAFFVDDNFTANPERTKKLLQAMIDARVRIRWSAQVRCDAARDPELLKLMQQSNCIAVYIGIESVNDEILEQMKKGQRIAEVSDAIDRFHRHKIRVHGMFILGFDGDDARSVRNTLRYALRTKLNTVQFMILTPLPGTPVFQDLKNDGRLITDDWSLYDAHHVVFKPKGMLPIDLQRLQIMVHKKFYSLVRRVKHLCNFNFFEFAIARYAARITHNWKKMNRFFLGWLKDFSQRLEDGLFSARPEDQSAEIEDTMNKNTE